MDDPGQDEDHFCADWLANIQWNVVEMQVSFLGSSEIQEPVWAQSSKVKSN